MNAVRERLHTYLTRTRSYLKKLRAFETEKSKIDALPGFPIRFKLSNIIETRFVENSAFCSCVISAQAFE